MQPIEGVCRKAESSHQKIKLIIILIQKVPALSVIICTHNPRPEFLRRVLDALKAQTLPLEQWELLLADNASKEWLDQLYDLSWHPNGRHLREETLGKAHALLTAMGEAKGELLMTVDDDNVLRSDFLANSLEIAKAFPFLGAWGGHVEGEFEQEVPDWLKPHLSALAVRPVDRDYWSNYYTDNRSMPFGAGLTVRKPVAIAYAKAMLARPVSAELGRKGSSLVSGEDVDLAMMAYDLGLGTGMFQRLYLTHIIPRTRMTVEYLCRLLEAIEYSTHILKSHRDPAYIPAEDGSTLRKWLRTFQVWRLPEPARSVVKAENRGFAKAKAEIISKRNGLSVSAI
ncbi:MAG: glycosyltransferase [Terracidiphilus sp.]